MLLNHKNYLRANGCGDDGSNSTTRNVACIHYGYDNKFIRYFFKVYFNRKIFTQ